MGTYTADQIINKNLVAKKNVPLYRTPNTGAPVIYTVPPGTSVGVVYSYITAKHNQPLFWVFLDSNKREYYAAHLPGNFSETSIQTQGAQTQEQIKAEQDEAKKTNLDKVLNTVTTLGTFAIIGVIASKALQK